MKKILIAALSIAFIAAPAFAGSMTIEFTDAADGTTTVMVLSDDGTASVEGLDGTFPYTWDAEANELCGNYNGEGEVCATFEGTAAEPTVGETATYTTSDGKSGVSEILAITE